jgi:hypothetical protein
MANHVKKSQIKRLKQRIKYTRERLERCKPHLVTKKNMLNSRLQVRIRHDVASRFGVRAFEIAELQRQVGTNNRKPGGTWYVRVKNTTVGAR